MMKSIFFVGVLQLIGSLVFAAIDQRLATDQKRHQYLEQGVFTGGEAGARSFTLLDVRRIYSKKDRIERVLIDLGDEKGRALKNTTSYFQVSIAKARSRVVIDLPQITGSNVDQARIQRLFRRSPAVKKVKVSYDPADSNITIQLELKRLAKLEVFKISPKDKPSRIAVDLKI